MTTLVRLLPKGLGRRYPASAKRIYRFMDPAARVGERLTHHPEANVYTIGYTNGVLIETLSVREAREQLPSVP